MRASFVRNRRRARLFDLWTFMVLIVLLVVALVLVFPQKLSLRATDYIERPSAVSLAYLQALVRAYPDDGWLRLQLARQYREVGQFPQASHVLDPLTRAGDTLPADLAAQARWLRARLDRDHMFTLPVGSPQRARLQRSLTERLGALAQSPGASAADLAWLAETALAVNQPRIAADVYRRLAGMAGEDRAQRLMDAGRWYSVADAPLEAAASYQAVVDSTAPAARRQEAAATLVRTWFNAGRVDRAHETVTRLLASFPNDPALLRLAQRAALEMGDPAGALDFALRRWPARRAMGMRTLEERLELETASGRLQAAAITAGVIVDRNPEDTAARRRLAQLLEWAGSPRDALEQWLWLARRGADVDRDPPVWQLALDLYEFETAQRLLLVRLSDRALEPSELEALRWATAQAGEPDLTLRGLAAAVEAGRADATHWRYWLALLREAGRREEWLRRIEAFAARFPVSTDLRVAWARTLMAEGAWSQALSVLDAGRPDDARAAPAYWEAVAAAALTLQDLGRSAAAYEALLQTGGNADTDAARRLLALSLFLGHRERALELADGLWARTGDPYFLVVALRTAEALGREAYVQGAVEPVRATARDYVDFWRFLAGYYRDRGAMAAAGRAYRRALALSPGARDLRAAYLWYLIERGKPTELTERLARWGEPGASGELAAALAAGYQSIGRYREALAWYGREAPQRRRDWLWLLGYADALDGAGYRPAAFRLRRYVLRGLLRQNGDVAPSAGVARAGLVRRFLGDSAGYRMVPSQPDGSAWYPLLTGWYLDSGFDDAARRGLLAAHRRRLTLPAWQRLGLALRDNDLSRIEAILAEDVALSRLDRAVAAQRLGRDARALALAQSAVGGRRTDAGGARSLAAALSSQLAPGVSVAAERAWSEDVSRHDLTGLLRRPVREGVVEVSAQARETRADDLLRGGAITAGDLALRWDGGAFRERWSGGLGVGARDGQARPTARVSLDMALHERLRVGASLNWNRTPEASLLLDAVTAYRGLALDGRWDATGRTAVLARGRYGSYVDWWDGGTVVRGFDGSLGVSELVWAEPVLWQLSLGVDWQVYDVDDSPGTGFGGRLEPDVGPDSLALERTRFYRFGSRWQHGEPGMLDGRATSPRWHLDLGTGWQSPQEELLFSVDAGIGWPLLGGDELALQARYSDNTRVAGGYQAGVGITYSYWFGR